MTDYDWGEIAMLLEVVEKAYGHPNLKPILDAAAARLNEIANPPKEPTEEEIANQNAAKEEEEKLAKQEAAARKHQDGVATEPQVNRRA